MAMSILVMFDHSKLGGRKPLLRQSNVSIEILIYEIFTTYLVLRLMMTTVARTVIKQI